MNETVYQSVVEADALHRKLTGIRGGACQSLKEIAEVIEYLGDRKFNNFVEVGANRGGSFFIYTTLLVTPFKHATGIDIEYYPEHTPTVDYLKKFYDAEILVKHGDIALNKIDNTIDLLHIDGWHSFDAVQSDFNRWYPKVIKGGVILLHDTVLHEGCAAFKRSLESTGYNIKTFYAGESQPGISVVIKD